eukprot:Skav226154  [mRNA]  locus=scaffold3275:7240:8613:+ [translate_table: standard]
MTEALKQELLRKGGTLGDWGMALTRGLSTLDQQWHDSKEIGTESAEEARRVMTQGSLAEYECYDAGGRAQGRAVIRLQEWADYGGAMVKADHVLASDGYYDWYARQNLKADKSVYHFCGGKRKDCKERLPRGDRREVVHVEKWRMITPLAMLDTPYLARLGHEALKEWVRSFVPTVPEPVLPPAPGPHPEGRGRAVTGVDQALQEVEEEVEKRAPLSGPKGEGRPEEKKVGPRGSVGALLERKAAEQRAALDQKEGKRKKEERGRSRSRKKKKKKGTSSRSSGSSGSRSSLFRKPLSGGGEELWRLSTKNPGKLLRQGMMELQRYLASRTESVGVPEEDQWMQLRMMAYVNQVILSQHPQSSMGIRNYRELVTVGTAIDLLLSGHLAQLGDLLMQRMKALESSLNDQGWQQARHQELIPPVGASLTSEMERRRSAKQELASAKLKEAIQKSRSSGNK